MNIFLIYTDFTGDIYVNIYIDVHKEDYEKLVYYHKSYIGIQHEEYDFLSTYGRGCNPLYSSRRPDQVVPVFSLKDDYTLVHITCSR